MHTELYGKKSCYAITATLTVVHRTFKGGCVFIWFCTSTQVAAYCHSIGYYHNANTNTDVVKLCM